MVNRHSLPHKRGDMCVENDDENYPSTVRGPNTSTHTTSMLGNVQKYIVVHV